MDTARDRESAAEVIREFNLPLDPLPYTPEFDVIHRRLEQRLGRSCTQNQAWLLLLAARKSGRAGRKERCIQV